MKKNVWILCYFFILLLAASACKETPNTSHPMPWDTGSGCVDSLLTRVDSLEMAPSYNHAFFITTLKRLDSISKRPNASKNLMWVGYYARLRLLENDALTQSGDSISLNPLILSAPPKEEVSPYFRARIILAQASSQHDLKEKADMLFGILPAFVDAADSMRVVETLYQLNEAYGRIWDVETQLDYMGEILNYVPDSIPALKGIIHTNIIRLQRRRKNNEAYLSALDSMRCRHDLMQIAPPLGVMVYSDIYRIRGNDSDLDTASFYMRALETDHEASRVYHIQKLTQALRRFDADSAAIYAREVEKRLGIGETSIDIESMESLASYYIATGRRQEADSMRRRLDSALKSVDAYERALALARMNADRRIADFRQYSETSHRRLKMQSWAMIAVASLLLAVAVGFVVIIRRKHRSSDKELRGRLLNAHRRLTVAQMREDETKRAISSVLGNIASPDLPPEETPAPLDAEQIRKQLRRQLAGDDEWTLFMAQFTEMRPGFLDNLSNAYPNLTAGDLKFCCLLEMGLDNKHIASLLHIRPESAKKHRHRLRVKFGVTPEVDWKEFFSRF